MLWTREIHPLSQALQNKYIDFNARLTAGIFLLKAKFEVLYS